MKPRTLALKHEDDLFVSAKTDNLDAGIVIMRQRNHVEILLRPIEAEKLARVLQVAARAARAEAAKAKHAKARAR